MSKWHVFANGMLVGTLIIELTFFFTGGLTLFKNSIANIGYGLTTIVLAVLLIIEVWRN